MIPYRSIQQRDSWRYCLTCLCITSALLVMSVSVASDQTMTVNRLKTALIYKLVNFVYWPEERADASIPFGICVMGDRNLARGLRQIEGRPIGVQRIMIYETPYTESIRDDCFVVYIGEQRERYLGKILPKLKTKPVLTIGGGSAPFARLGGVVELDLSAKPVGLTINLAAAKQHGLTISAPLLSMATVLKNETKK